MDPKPKRQWVVYEHLLTTGSATDTRAKRLAVFDNKADALDFKEARLAEITQASFHDVWIKSEVKT